MKKIRIKICEFGRGNDFLKDHFICQILKKYYDVEMSEDPEYLFYNETSYEYLNHNCIRIFYTGENISPNFNLCDYATGFDYIDFGDRYYRFPLYLTLGFCREEWAMGFGINVDLTKVETFISEDLAKKNEFCSFVYSNYMADESRKTFFNKLSKYKKVNAAGAYLNNTGGEKIKNKVEYELKHKFSIAFENSSRVGYTTEKLTSSLAAKTIPIYWGNPEIGKEFNKKRFINCHDFANFDRVVERIKEIDSNDDLYLSIINEPVTMPNYNFKEVRQGFEEFLRNIIDQPLNSARRATINSGKAMEIAKYESIIAKYVKRQAVIRKIFAKLYQPFKKIKILENLKQRYFQRNKRSS